ncbi:GGDEF domain-containing protein [Rhizobium sp. P44RR-XXIV]|uniref:GGDEF domain-containing protein n=1 Tax=Rhizobium sp. P44RR-XXIV TaxID=1921145 RepID=UPI001FEDFD79|nr:GGDEF domain-containing protein [Rhizobium sp. P44RR-XXIV]
MPIVLNMTTGLTIWCSEAITLATVLLLAWRHDRQSPAYLMWALGFSVSAIGFAMVAARGIIPDIWSIQIGNAVALLGESAWIAGFRWMDKRRLEWSALMPPAIWLVGVSLPWVSDNFVNRVILYDLAGAAGATLLAFAVHPGEGRREPARGQLGVVFMTLACFCFLSGVWMSLLRPTLEEALIYRGYAALGYALIVIVAIVLNGKLLMERSERRWRAISITDTLTGVLNRRGLQESYDILVSDKQRQPQKLAALLFDLDHFKSINDRHGHQTGDMVLTEFARIARQFVPRNGAFGRMGGEEFVAFVPIDDQAQAEALAETIRADFCRVPLLAGPSLVSATVSVGLAMMPRDTVSWDRLVSSADRALYAAKRAGRNCTIVFNEAETAKAADTPPDTDGGELVPTIEDQIHALRRLGKLAGM